jgi:hypothetical protein
VCLILARTSPRFLAASVVEIALDIHKFVIYKKADVKNTHSPPASLFSILLGRLPRELLLNSSSPVPQALTTLITLARRVGNAY